MPELPEVETIRRGLADRILGRRVEAVVVRQPLLRWPVPADLGVRLRGGRIDAVERRAKYLLIHVGRQRLLIHLGMSGRVFVLTAPPAPDVHDHLDLALSRGVTLRFHDPRRFGCVLAFADTDPPHPLLADIGPEPFSPAFSGDYLYARSRGRRSPVKAMLMDSSVVAGVGNIYAAEALFRAGIRPRRAAGRVSRVEYARLAAAVREVLSAAIRAGGTTLADSTFAGADGAFGYFQQRLAVYAREGQPCPRCAVPVRRQIVAQRSSFYCPRCQR